MWVGERGSRPSLGLVFVWFLLPCGLVFSSFLSYATGGVGWCWHRPPRTSLVAPMLLSTHGDAAPAVRRSGADCPCARNAGSAHQLRNVLEWTPPTPPPPSASIELLPLLPPPTRWPSSRKSAGAPSRPPPPVARRGRSTPWRFRGACHSPPPLHRGGHHRRPSGAQAKRPPRHGPATALYSQ